MQKSFVILFLTCLTISSCSTIHLNERYKKDRDLGDTSFHNLKGFYNNYSTSYDSNNTVISMLNPDALNLAKDLKLNLEPIDNKTLKVNFYSKDTFVSTSTFKGKYKRGYFKIKRVWTKHFVLGPLFWGLGNNIKYIGLTKSDDLVIISSTSALVLVVFIPVYNGGGQFNREFKRIK